jgi:2,4-dienoyl-CoA reductase-like NADH-dependent reductase (Old Yellow Enzyme family)
VPEIEYEPASLITALPVQTDRQQLHLGRDQLYRLRAVTQKRKSRDAKKTTLSVSNWRRILTPTPGSTDPLLTPFKLGKRTVKNRIFSSGHALSHAVHGRATETTLRYQMEKAKGGIGLSFVGGSGTVSIDTAPVFDQLIIDDDIIPFFSELSDFYHQHDALLMTQITHLGRRTNANAGEWVPIVAPSATREILHGGFPRAMDEEDIHRIVKDFAAAAIRCKTGDLDGLEVIASGHLIDQFWSPATNHRQDKYGGTLENRMRFGRMVFEAMREAVGDGFLLGVRMTMTEHDHDTSGLSFEDNIEIAQRLQDDGMLDFLNLVSGRIDSMPRLTNYMPGMAAPLAPFLQQVAMFRKEVTLPVFHATRINDLATARHAITENIVDMVGMTRGHIADPHIVDKLMEGEEDRIRSCVGATYCSNFKHCIQNPATARESTLPHRISENTDRQKKIVVVGAGPGGLEAARVCAARGHEVVVFEAADRVGGQVLLAGKVRWRTDLNTIMERECAILGVDIRCNRLAGPEDVLAQDPDVVIIATGGLPNVDWIEGNGAVVSSWDVLSGMASLNGSVFVHDLTGRNTALAVADFLSEQGTEVTLNTQDAHIGAEAMRLELSPFMKRFYERGVKMTVDQELTAAHAEDRQTRVTIRNMHTAESSEHYVDHLVVEGGTLPNDELFYELKHQSANDGVMDLDLLSKGLAQPDHGAGFHLYRVGDASGSRDIHCAMLDSLRLCNGI